MNEIESKDSDPEETQEWLDALSSVLQSQGTERVQYLLQKLSVKLTEQGSQLPYAITTPYRNTWRTMALNIEQVAWQTWLIGSKKVVEPNIIQGRR